jgi:UMF1 family MFS transporter
VPVTILITATVFSAAAMVTFLWLRERGGAAPYHPEQFSWGRTRDIWKDARATPGFLWLMGCAVAYQAGVSVVIALAAVYAEQAMGFKQTETMMLIFLVNIAAALGAFGFGYFQDVFGHKRALAATLWGWLLMIGLAYLAQAPLLFWIAAVVAGLCMGSSQSAGRALAGLLSPPEKSGAFFGLWSFATRLAAIIGPITYGIVTWVTDGNHRAGLLSTSVFFVLGLLLLIPLQVPDHRRTVH